MRVNAMLLVSLGLIGACGVDTSGLPAPIDVAMDAHFTCAGAERTLSWTVDRLDRGREYCAAPDGGYSERQTCTLTEECGGTGACLDGLCVMPGISPDEIDRGEGCYEDVSVRVAGVGVDGSATVVAEGRGRTGSVTVSPEQSTTYVVTSETASGEVDRQSVAVKVVPNEAEVPPPFEEPLVFAPPNCQPLTEALFKLLADEAPTPLIGGGGVTIQRVTNASPYEILAATDDPVRGPVVLRPGEITEALNGALKGLWTVQPARPVRSPIPAADCTVAGVDPPDPVTLVIELVCLGGD